MRRRRPWERLHRLALCRRAAQGDPEATRLARELDDALHALSTFEGPDLVLYGKHLAVLLGGRRVRPRARGVRHRRRKPEGVRGSAAAAVPELVARLAGEGYGAA